MNVSICRNYVVLGERDKQFCNKHNSFAALVNLVIRFTMCVTILYVYYTVPTGYSYLYVISIVRLIFSYLFTQWKQQCTFGFFCGQSLGIRLIRNKKSSVNWKWHILHGTREKQSFGVAIQFVKLGEKKSIYVYIPCAWEAMANLNV